MRRATASKAAERRSTASVCVARCVEPLSTMAAREEHGAGVLHVVSDSRSRFHSRRSTYEYKPRLLRDICMCFSLKASLVCVLRRFR